MMHEPIHFMLHTDGAHDPTIVRAIHTAAQFAYERTHCNETEAAVLACAGVRAGNWQMQPSTATRTYYGLAPR